MQRRTDNHGSNCFARPRFGSNCYASAETKAKAFKATAIKITEFNGRNVEYRAALHCVKLIPAATSEKSLRSAFLVALPADKDAATNEQHANPNAFPRGVLSARYNPSQFPP